MASEFDIVDVHVHLQRDVLLEKLMYPKPGWPDNWYWFTPSRIASYMKFWNITNVVSVNLMNERRIEYERAILRGLPATQRISEPASNEELRAIVRNLNEWGLEVGGKEPRIHQFMATEPELFGDDLIDEVDGWLKRGGAGLKVHPRVGHHLPSHPSMLPVYDLCQQLGVPILTDTGGVAENGRPPLTHPDYWIPVLRDFPRLKVVLAHFGGEFWESRVEISSQFKSENVLFDLAGGLVDAHHPRGPHRELSTTDAPGVFRRVGVERILFGSDAPHLDPMTTARQVAALNLSDDEKQLILAGNARRLLAL